MSGISTPALQPTSTTAMAPIVEQPDIAVHLVDGVEGIAGLAAEWQGLYRGTGRELSLSFAWTFAVASVYATPSDRVRTITLRRDGRLVGVLPIVARTTRRAFWHLTPLAEDYNTHSDWLVADASPAIAAGFVDGLILAGVKWDRFRMSRVLEHNPLLPLFVAALRRRGVRFLLRTEPPSYVLPLPPAYPVYLAARSAKFRNHLKRVEKKILARRVEVTVFAGDQPAEGFAAAFDRILAVERTSWKHAHGWAMTSGSRATEFWRQVCASAWAEGRIHVQCLALDGQPAAYNLGYIVGDEYAYLKTSFGSEFRDIGAATFLRARLVADLIARGIRVVDFPGEPYEWERQWTDDVRGHVMLTAYSGSLRSRALEAMERLRHGHHAWSETPAALHDAAPAAR